MDSLMYQIVINSFLQYLYKCYMTDEDLDIKLWLSNEVAEKGNLSDFNNSFLSEMGVFNKIYNKKLEEFIHQNKVGTKFKKLAQQEQRNLINKLILYLLDKSNNTFIEKLPPENTLSFKHNNDNKVIPNKYYSY